MLSSVFFAWRTALPAILLDSWTCRPISLTDEVISSVAAATAWIFSVTVFEADEAEPDSDIVTSDVFVKVVADVANSVEAAASEPTNLPIIASNSRVAVLMRSARAVLIFASALAASSDSFLEMSADLKIWSALAIRPISVLSP